jgi:hypothetical protein
MQTYSEPVLDNGHFVDNFVTRETFADEADESFSATPSPASAPKAVERAVRNEYTSPSEYSTPDEYTEHVERIQRIEQLAVVQAEPEPSYTDFMDRLAAMVDQATQSTAKNTARESIRLYTEGLTTNNLELPLPMDSAICIPCVPLFGVKRRTLPPITDARVQVARRQTSDFGVGLPPTSTY